LRGWKTTQLEEETHHVWLFCRCGGCLCGLSIDPTPTVWLGPSLGRGGLRIRRRLWPPHVHSPNLRTPEYDTRSGEGPSGSHGKPSNGGAVVPRRGWKDERGSGAGDPRRCL